MAKIFIQKKKNPDGGRLKQLIDLEISKDLKLMIFTAEVMLGAIAKVML
jgi:hypothetical protein